MLGFYFLNEVLAMATSFCTLIAPRRQEGCTNNDLAPFCRFDVLDSVFSLGVGNIDFTNMKWFAQAGNKALN